MNGIPGFLCLLRRVAGGYADTSFAGWRRGAVAHLLIHARTPELEASAPSPNCGACLAFYVFVKETSRRVFFLFSFCFVSLFVESSFLVLVFWCRNKTLALLLGWFYYSSLRLRRGHVGRPLPPPLVSALLQQGQPTKHITRFRLAYQKHFGPVLWTRGRFQNRHYTKSTLPAKTSA